MPRGRLVLRSPVPAQRRCTRTAQALSLLLLVLACRNEDQPEPPSFFAADLGVDLDEMERTDSGLYVRVLKPGQGERATPGQRIAIHYTGWLPDGTRIEATRERGPVMVTIGEGYLIDGIMEGVEGIRIGEERLLVIKPELGYETLEQSGVPPNSWLVFRVTRVTPPALGTAADAAPAELQAG